MTALRKQDNVQVTLSLVNGAVLRSKALYDRGNYYRQYSSVNPAHKKKQMPLLGLFSSGTNFHVAALDFDVIPAGLSTFEEIRELLREVPNAIVVSTPSGKAKAFFQFRWHNHHPRANEVATRLNELLPNILQNQYDPRGVDRCFLSQEIAEALSGLCSGSYFDWSELAHTRGIVSDSSNPIESLSFKYILADVESIPVEFTEFINPGRRGHESRLTFCRILVAAFKLTDDAGFSLPANTIAAQCGTGHGTVSTWLKWFRDNGHLRKVSNSYIVGLQAIKYVSSGVLRAAIVARRAVIEYVPVLPKKLPKDGEFYAYFLSMSNRGLTWLQYKAVIEQLPGIEEKNRFNMAASIFNCDIRKDKK